MLHGERGPPPGGGDDAAADEELQRHDDMTDMTGMFMDNANMTRLWMQREGLDRGDFGDLYVQIKTEVPVYLNKEQRSLLEKFREIENEKSNPSIKKFFQKAKDFWKS